MAIDMTKIKHILFTLFSIGNMQTSVTDKPDGSVSCLIFVTSLIGFFFPVLEIYESPISFERFFLQFSCGCLCLLSTAAWIHLLHCYKNNHKCIWIVLYLWLTQLQDFYTDFFLYLHLEYFYIKDWIAFWISLATKNSMSFIILAPALTG